MLFDFSLMELFTVLFDYHFCKGLQAKKVHGILLGFSFGLQNGFQGVLYDFHIGIISEISCF